MKRIFIILFICSLAYGDSGPILDGNDPYYVTTVYDGNDLRGIQYVQSNDVMYLVHPDYQPQKLIRFDHNDWTIGDVNFTCGPFLDENTNTDITITPSGKTGDINLEANSGIFDGNHVGSLWRISHVVDSNVVTARFYGGTPAQESNSDSVNVKRGQDITLTADGYFRGTVSLQRSTDGTNYHDMFSQYTDGSPIQYSGSEKYEDASYRIHFLYPSDPYGSCFCTFTALSTKVNGYCEITAFTDSNSVTATVDSNNPIGDPCSTYMWSEAAWSDYRGWPRAICLFQNRLCFAGTAYEPLTLWCSKSADYENMEVTGLDDGAINYQVAAAKQNPILWLADRDAIIAGTSGSMIKIGSTSSTKTLTLETIGSQRYTETGTSDIQAQAVDDSIIYVGRKNKKVYDLIYDIQSDGYVSPELTIFSESIIEPNIVEMAWQRRPDTIGWFVKSDGNMVTLTYNRSHGIAAWSEIATDGDFESVAVIPGSDEDEVWCIVERTIDSTTYKYVEKFHPQDWSDDIWFVDSGLEYSGSATTTLTGADHLEGESVQVYSDANGYLGDFTVSSGNITLDSSETQAIAGLGYKSEIKTFPIEIGHERGVSVGVRKNIREIVLCLYKSRDGRYGFEDMWDIKYPSYTGDYFTGQIKTDLMSGYKDEIYIIVDQNEPYPLGLTGIALTKFEVHSDN